MTTAYTFQIETHSADLEARMKIAHPPSRASSHMYNMLHHPVFIDPGLLTKTDSIDRLPTAKTTHEILVNRKRLARDRALVDGAY